MLNIKFYYCREHNNIIEITNGQNKDICIEKENLVELIPNTVDAATEKHVPCVTFEGDTLKVNVGEVTHPMSEEHLISAIYVVTDKNTIYRKYLKATDTPTLEIENIDSKHVDVYSYCNLHGLWKKSI